MKRFLAALFFLILTAVIVYGIVRPRNDEPSGPRTQTGQVLFPSSTPVPQVQQDQAEQGIRQAFYADPSAQDFSSDLIAVSGDFAVLVWSDENTGGMALLRKEQDGGWQVIVSDGGAFSIEDLIAIGVPQSNANELGTLLAIP